MKNILDSIANAMGIIADARMEFIEEVKGCNNATTALLISAMGEIEDRLDALHFELQNVELEDVSDAKNAMKFVQIYTVANKLMTHIVSYKDLTPAIKEVVDNLKVGESITESIAMFGWAYLRIE